jgi:hypothetical protein
VGHEVRLAKLPCRAGRSTLPTSATAPQARPALLAVHGHPEIGGDQRRDIWAVRVEERDEHGIAVVLRQRDRLAQVVVQGIGGTRLAGSAGVPTNPRPAADCCAPVGSVASVEPLMTAKVSAPPIPIGNTND